MIIVILRMIVRPEKREEFIKTIRMMLEPTRVEAGCKSCCFYQDVSSENAFLFVEQWESQLDLDNHLRKRSFKKMLFLMDLLSESPEIQFNKVEQAKGIGKIKSLLGTYSTES